MSTHQQAKPRRANQSITDESGRPGTCRSNVGCEAIDEPCTKSATGLPSGEPANFSHRNRRTSPLFVQCSTPSTGASVAKALAAEVIAVRSSVDPCAGLVDHLRPQLLLRHEIRSELGGRRAHDLGPDAGEIA